MMQYITRKGTFDAAHRVLHQTSACRNLHGHLYQYELTFKHDHIEDIGYAIDFKEIKRIVGQFIEDRFDHGFIANPTDSVFLEACDQVHSKVWTVTLNGKSGFCNPTAENISKEIFLLSEKLLTTKNLKIYSVRLYETPNCFVDCTSNSITYDERVNFLTNRKEELEKYKNEKGTVIYDNRLINAPVG